MKISFKHMAAIATASVLCFCMAASAAPRKEVKILTRSGTWEQMSVSRSRARKIQKGHRMNTTTMMRFYKEKWSGGSIYLLVTFPLPDADAKLPHLNNSNIQTFCIPDGIVRIVRSQAKRQMLMEI